VIGEALVDLVPRGQAGDYRAHAGGSPFNVAVGLARLGNRTALMARLADNSFGRLLRDAAAAESIDLSAAPRATEPTTLAVVSVDDAAHATYDFYIEGTADWEWTAAELASLPADTEILQFGSIAAWTAPGSELIDQAVADAHATGRVLVSYDPNVRPAVFGDRARGRELIERSVRHAHVVKASREDLEWLYPSDSVDEVVPRWNELGAALVVVTDGADGATAYRNGAGPLRRPGRAITLVDTIGAGDSFTSGLLSGLDRRDFHIPERVAAIPDAALVDVIDEAVLVSSMTCERVGADPPRAASPAVGARPLTVDDFVRP
jgi:fructokinase